MIKSEYIFARYRQLYRVIICGYLSPAANIWEASDARAIDSVESMNSAQNFAVDTSHSCAILQPNFLHRFLLYALAGCHSNFRARTVDNPEVLAFSENIETAAPLESPPHQLQHPDTIERM